MPATCKMIPPCTTLLTNLHPQPSLLLLYIMCAAAVPHPAATNAQRHVDAWTAELSCQTAPEAVRCCSCEPPTAYDTTSSSTAQTSNNRHDRHTTALLLQNSQLAAVVHGTVYPTKQCSVTMCAAAEQQLLCSKLSPSQARRPATCTPCARIDAAGSAATSVLRTVRKPPATPQPLYHNERNPSKSPPSPH
jgi:hypothetical protein